MSNLKGVLIDPVNKSIEMVEVGNDCKSIAKVLNCEWVEQVNCGGDARMIVDEEGKLVRPNPNGYFRLSVSGAVMAGKALVVRDGGDGEWHDCRVPIEAIRASVEFVDHDGVAESEIEPRVRVYAMNDDMSRGELRHEYVKPVKRLDS
jgi:hypothetical protein